LSHESCQVVYFREGGAANTDETLRLAKRRADELGIRNVVIASYSGVTGVKASQVFKGYNLIVVAGMVGFIEPNQDRLLPENRRIIEESGGKILRACHAFGGLGRAVNRKFGAIQVDEVIAHVLRLFGAGVKVACEVACMAADAGYFRTDEDCVAIGGTGGGADAAIVLLPSNTHRFFDMRIREIICKPRQWEKKQ
jgi:hypothetical protein